MALKFEAQLDPKARAWNVVDTTTDQIVGMFGGGTAGERQARRSADNHNQQWLQDGLAEYDAFTIEMAETEDVFPEDAGHEEAEANASLIVAAPALYEALSFIVSEIETDGGVDTSEWLALDKARAALALARGETK